jgi:MbtH protein
MSGNPFDAGSGEWLVVVDTAGRHALWRPHLDLPAGWTVVYTGPDRDGALDFVEQHCTALT